jgi:hypothetical protein
MRIMAGMAVAALGIGAAQAVEPQELAAVRVVSPWTLDTPGALAALKESNPGHYQRAVAILELASEMPCEGAPRILQTQVEAASVACRASRIYTSWPAQRDVSFVLDDTLYSARVVLREREKLTPLQPRR